MTKENEPEVKSDTDEFNELAENLRKIEEANTIDESALEKLGEQVSKLSGPAQTAFYNLPIVQRIANRVGEQVTGEPGEYVKKGIFNTKVPWKLKDVERFKKVKYSPEQDWDITWNGLNYKLFRDTEYELPEPVYQIIIDNKQDAKVARAVAESGGLPGGVKFIEVGWPGKDRMDAVGAGNA